MRLTAKEQAEVWRLGLHKLITECQSRINSDLYALHYYKDQDQRTRRLLSLAQNRALLDRLIEEHLVLGEQRLKNNLDTAPEGE